LRRRGVAGYLEVFLLIGVVVLGSAAVFAAVRTMASDGGGPAIALSDLSIAQGRWGAVERFVVANVGTGEVPYLLVSTSGVAPGIVFCYSVSDALTGEPLVSSCPGTSVYSQPARLEAAFGPGASVVAQLTFYGAAFPPGGRCDLVVNAADGAQASLSGLVVQP
jgi:hypothetical protein